MLQFATRLFVPSTAAHHFPCPFGKYVRERHTIDIIYMRIEMAQRSTHITHAPRYTGLPTGECARERALCDGCVRWRWPSPRGGCDSVCSNFETSRTSSLNKFDDTHVQSAGNRRPYKSACFVYHLSREKIQSKNHGQKAKV